MSPVFESKSPKFVVTVTGLCQCSMMSALNMGLPCYCICHCQLFFVMSLLVLFFLCLSLLSVGQLFHSQCLIYYVRVCCVSSLSMSDVCHVYRLSRSPCVSMSSGSQS